MVQGTTPTTRSRRQVERWNGLQFIEMGEFKKRRAKSKAARKARRKQRKNKK